MKVVIFLNRFLHVRNLNQFIWRNNSMGQSTKNLSSYYFLLLIACYLVFIGFASFYLTGNIPSAETAINRLLFRLGNFRFSLHNLRDVSTNILLYMPLGFLVAMLIASSKRAIAISYHLLWGVLLSIAVEITQAFIGRFPDFADIFSNGIGYACGFLIAQMSVNRFGIKPAVLIGIESQGNTAAINTFEGFRFIYVTVAFITSLLPLDITVSLSDIYEKLSASGSSMPRLIVDPLYHFEFVAADIQYLTLSMLLFLPLAFLSALIQIRRGQPSIFIPAFHCLMLGVCVEGANLFIRSGRTDILIPLMGFCGGCLMAAAVVFFTRRNKALPGANQKLDQRYYFLSIGLLYCILLLAISLSPYEFELSLNAVKTKLLVESNFIPFMAHFSTRSIAAAIDIVREVILYAPLGAIVGLVLQSSNEKVAGQSAVFLAVIVGGTLAVTLELLQLIVVGRYVDLTDCLLGMLGSLIGVRLSPLFAFKKGAAAK